MEGTKQYRHETNPKEKEFHDNFKEHTPLEMSRIVFGSLDGNTPAEFLDEKGQEIAINTIQWLGSPVGQSFLKECGFVLDNSK